MTALKRPEYGFGLYTAVAHILVTPVKEGVFEVEVSDPFSYDRKTKMFKAGADPTEWTSRTMSNYMRRWIKKNHKVVS